MPLIINDYRCEVCSIVEERMVYSGDPVFCRHCGCQMAWVPGSPGSNPANQDSPWVRSVLDVVDKSDRSRATQEFVRNPTRDTLKAWMKDKGLRQMDPGEQIVTQRKDPDMRPIAREMAEKAMKRRRIHWSGE